MTQKIHFGGVSAICRNNHNKLSRRLTTWTAVLCLAMSQVWPHSLAVAEETPLQRPLLLAQTDSGSSRWSADIDIDPPVIEHEALKTGVPGELQVFSAEVFDDRGLESVQLFYRSRPGGDYESVAMTSEGSTFTATVETQLGQREIQYYIEALDTGGNRVLKGFPFFPLVRPLESSSVNPASQVDAEPESDSKVLYVILGIAVVGLLAAMSGDKKSPENTRSLEIEVLQP